MIGGTFRLIEQIGAGSGGTVFRAEQLTLERVVALKILRPDWATNARAQAQFFHEAKLAARLSHPHIATILDFGRSNNILYLAMEYVPGPTLRQWVAQQTTVAVADVLRFGAQLLSALSEAHNAGIIHGDVKSDNVMVQRARVGNPWVKLVDFGVARLGHDGGGHTLGTQGYAAPELREGHLATVQSDLFSVGVILFEMVTGQLPRLASMSKRPDTDAIGLALTAHRNDIPQDLIAVVETALADDPTARFRSAVDMRAALTGEVIVDRPIHAVRASSELSTSITDTALFPLPWLGPRDDTDLVASHLEHAIGPILVMGTIGSGRTRMLTEAATRASATGRVIIHLQPDPTGQRQTLYPIRALVAALVGAGDGHADLAAVAEVLSGTALADVLAGVDVEHRLLPFLLGLADGFTELEPDVRRTEMISLLTKLILRVAASLPLALLLDDADEFDDLSLHVIRGLIADVPMALSCDPSWAEHWPAETMRVFVAPLVEAHFVQARSYLAGRVALPDVNELLASSQGSPTWLEQAVLHLDRGAAPAELDLPLEQLIAARWARMPSAISELCAMAAVFGREVEVSTLTAALPSIDALPRAEAHAWLIVERGLVRWNHPLLRDVVYGQLTDDLRCAYHARAAAVLAEITSDAAVLGLHFERAGAWDDAAETLVVAGEQAARLGDAAGAVAWFERAMECLRALLDSDKPVRPHLVQVGLLLATALRQTGAHAHARTLLTECRAWASLRSEHAAIDRLFALALADGGDVDEAARMIRRGIGLAAAGGDMPVVVDLYLDLAHVLVRYGRGEEAIAELSHAIDRATGGEGLRSLQAPPNLWTIVRRRAKLQAARGNIMVAIDDATSAYRLAATVGSTLGQARSLSLLADLMDLVGDVAAADTRKAARAALLELGQRAPTGS